MSATYIHIKRKAGLSQLILRFLAVLYFIGLVVTLCYLWFLTQDRFESNAAFKISRQDATGAQSGMLQLALPGLSDSGSSDSQLAIGYINSADLLLDLEKEFDLAKRYSAPSKDLVFRLDPKANLEERLEYYRKRITAHFDMVSGLTMVTVDTFDPALSQEIATRVLEKSEAYLNVVDQNIAQQQLGFVRGEVERTAKKVEEVNNEMISLQNENNFISPDEVIAGNLKAVQDMRMESLRAEAELSSILRDSPNSPRIDSIRSHIRSLNELIDTESAKLSGPEKDRLNQLLMRFKELQLRLEFATRLRTGAETLLEKNRNGAAAQSRFFTVIQRPYRPEDIATPRRAYATTSILCLGVLAFLILRALTLSVFERA
ncbi:MAG: hypothetical protein ABI162_14140 [Luteolibacter sp.]